MGFTKLRHKLSPRQPELTSLARDRGFNEVVVLTNFDVLENIFDENKISNLRIFNTGEASLSVVQCPEKFIEQKANIRFEPSQCANKDRM
jgi:hypothetical protein